MTELSRDDFNKAHPLGSGELPDVKVTGSTRALVDHKIAEGQTTPAYVKLARDVIRDTVAHNGETIKVVPTHELRHMMSAEKPSIVAQIGRTQPTR